VKCVVEGPNWLLRKTLRVPKPTCSDVLKQTRKFGSFTASGSPPFLLTGAHSIAWPRSVTATTFAANWLCTVMPVGLGPETPERAWHREGGMVGGVVLAGGRGSHPRVAAG